MANVIEGKKGGKNAKGISLIELSIVLTISGMILVPLLIMAQIYMEQYRQEKLLRLEKIVHNTMKAYMQRYNRYPCPALRPTGATPAAFGDGAENCSALTIDGARAVWSAPDADNNKVMVGVFPEYTMESGQRVYLKSFIPPDEPIVRDFIDPWGGRLTYFVTKGLTDSSKFNSANGTVAVVDENGNPTDGINKDALYALVSHGSDQAGAVNVNGIVTSPCPEASEHELENPNCGSSSMVNAPVVSGLIRKGAGVRSVDDGAGTTKNIHDYYNDHVFSRRFYEKDLWIPLPEGNNARVNLYSQTGKNIGVGTSNPQEALDLVGPPSATGGNIQIDRALVMGFNKYTNDANDKDKTGLICTTKDDDNDGVIDENSNNQLDDNELTCINPITFFKMKCSADEYMKGISIDANYNLVTTCETFRVTPPATGNAPECPTNKVIRGIYSNGNIMCASGETSDNGSNHSWVVP